MSQKALTHLCNQSPQIALQSTCSNGGEAINYVNDHKVDLLLLDVEMPEMNGIELLENLSYFPHVIMTTGNTEYAYEAYEYNVTDFLKKPIIPSRFQKAINKVVETHSRIEQYAQTSLGKEIYIKTDGRLVRLEYDQILYFENVGDYVKVITADNSYIIYGALKAIDKKIKNSRFLKVHRSFIVNLDKIVDIEDNSIVIDKKVIPISRAHKPLLLNSINLL